MLSNRPDRDGPSHGGGSPDDITARQQGYG